MKYCRDCSNLCSVDLAQSQLFIQSLVISHKVVVVVLSFQFLVNFTVTCFINAQQWTTEFTSNLFFASEINQSDFFYSYKVFLVAIDFWLVFFLGGWHEQDKIFLRLQEYHGNWSTWFKLLAIILSIILIKKHQQMQSHYLTWTWSQNQWCFLDCGRCQRYLIHSLLRDNFCCCHWGLVKHMTN